MIKNLTTKKKIANGKRYADTFFKRMMGLMFTLPRIDEGLIFTFPKTMEASLHMFFVFYPIDILWLDEKKNVVDLRTNAIPFTPLIIPKKKAKYVIELPAYSIDYSETEIGNKISF
ncbi:MAG: DUF192 domain-containing protein [Candidatus Woesearchaeota archaeon]